MSFVNDLQQAYNKATIAEKIIYINVLIFLICVFFGNFMLNNFGLPSSTDDLISKPWTLFTYAFVHFRFIHLLSNVIVLYFLGNLFLNFYSKKQFVNFYFLGLLISGIVFLAYNSLTSENDTVLIGASAAVSAIFIGIAAKIPRYAVLLRFIGSVELWVLALIWVILSILGLATDNKGEAIAHLTGSLFGYMYAKQLIKGNDIGSWFEQILNGFSNVFKSNRKKTMKTVYKSPRKSARKSEPLTKQRKIDDILDKISKSGYESLSQEEKDFLFRSGKK